MRTRIGYWKLRGRKIKRIQNVYIFWTTEPQGIKPGRTNKWKCLLINKLWRRRQDSNLRYPHEYNGFQDRRLKPLDHSSALKWISPTLPRHRQRWKVLSEPAPCYAPDMPTCASSTLTRCLAPLNPVKPLRFFTAHHGELWRYCSRFGSGWI